MSHLAVSNTSALSASRRSIWTGRALRRSRLLAGDGFAAACDHRALCLAAHRSAILTGYLGGAVATHARIDDPLFSHTLFGVYLGIALWGGLWLRDARVRTLLPVS